MLEMKQITLTIVLALLAIDYAGAAADVDAGDRHVLKLGQLINDYRAQHDVPPLALDAPLSELAHVRRECRLESAYAGGRIRSVAGFTRACAQPRRSQDHADGYRHRGPVRRVLCLPVNASPACAGEPRLTSAVTGCSP